LTGFDPVEISNNGFVFLQRKSFQRPFIKFFTVR